MVEAEMVVQEAFLKWHLSCYPLLITSNGTVSVTQIH